MSLPIAAQELLVTSEDTASVVHYSALTGALLGDFVPYPGGGLFDPRGMTLGPDGNLYVADDDDIGRIKRYNGVTGAYIDDFVPDGGGLTPPAKFGPQGIVFGPDGNLYVTTGDPYHSVMRFDGLTGRPLPASGKTDATFVSTESGGLLYPHGLTFGPDGNLYVVSQGTGTVKRYDGITGNYMDDFASGGFVGLVFGPDGNLYVSSAFDESIKQYDGKTGAFLGNFVSSNSGGLNEPLGLTFGFDDNLYVCDFANNSIKRYNGKTGAYIDDFVSSGLKHPWYPVFTLPPQISPNHGGNAGLVSVTIAHRNIQKGATVILHTDGQPDIIGNDPQVSPYGYIQAMRTTFDLRGATPGAYSVIINQPDGTQLTLSNRFTVETGGVARLTTEVLGRTALRAGFVRTYNVLIKNEGNVDGYAADLRIEFPKYFDWKLGTDTAQSVFTGENSTSISVNLPVVPPGISKVVPLTVLVPADAQYAHQPFRILAWVNPSADAKLIYIGDLTEPLIMRLEDAVGNAISYVGLMSGGRTTSLQTIRIDAIDDTITTINLDSQGRTILERGSNGVALNINWLSDTLSRITPVFPDGHLGSSFDVDISGTTPHGYPPFPTNPQDVCDFIAQLMNWFCPFSPWADKVCFLLVEQPEFVPPCLYAAKAFQIACILNYSPSKVADPSQPSVINILCAALHWLLGEIITPKDPNELIGPIGVDQPHWISGEQPLPYTVLFENVPTASASAQEVVVTNQLDIANVDLSSVSLGPISFGDKVVTPIAGISPVAGIRDYQADVDLRPDRNLIVHISASLDIGAGLLSWRFISLDPDTMLPPEDSLVGFLDPGQEGSVVFTVQSKKGLPTGTVVKDQARVIFDANTAVYTPQWFNTLDNDMPVSKVNALPTVQTSPSFLVSWQGTDVGSGLRDFTISVSDNSGPFTPWLTNTTDTQATFTGQVGHKYDFIISARDNVFDTEAAHLLPDATTKIVQDITNQLRITRSGLVYNRQTKQYTGTLTLTNIGSQSLTGPFDIVLSNLTNGATLVNANGLFKGAPYITSNTTSLAPRASVTVPVQFSYFGTARLDYTSTVYSGSF